jgi:hypothetical protein
MLLEGEKYLKNDLKSIVEIDFIQVYVFHF